MLGLVNLINQGRTRREKLGGAEGNLTNFSPLARLTETNFLLKSCIFKYYTSFKSYFPQFLPDLRL